MKNAKHELAIFLAGIVMLGVGLFIFSQQVEVTTGWFFGTGFGNRLVGGLIFLPLIAGIIWLFASGGQIGSKILTGFGVIIILVSVISSLHLYVSHTPLYVWIIIFVLIFGGVGFIARVLFDGRKDDENMGYRARKNRRDAKKHGKHGKYGKDDDDNGTNDSVCNSGHNGNGNNGNGNNGNASAGNVNTGNRSEETDAARAARLEAELEELKKKINQQ